MKYRILKCSDIHIKEYQRKIEQLLNDGWQLQGDLKVIVTHNEFIEYIQVIIKKDVL